MKDTEDGFKNSGQAFEADLDQITELDEEEEVEEKES